MNRPAGDYTLCGWRVRSDIHLPELGEWAGDDRAPQIRFEIGEVQPALEDPLVATPVVQVDAAGRIRFEIEDVGAYLVEEGARITLAPRLPLDAPDLRLFLLGAGFGLLCHQRGIVPIHAAAIEVDGRAVLLAGASGAGKSTLAAAFLRRGHRVLSDDVAPLDPEGWILPSLQRIRLWRDSADQADWAVGELEACRVGMQKFSRPLADSHADAPLRPSALIHLLRPTSGKPEITLERLRGVAAVTAMRPQIYRWRTLVGLLSRIGALSRVGMAAHLIPRHFALRRPMRYSDLSATVDKIVETVRDAA